MTNLKHSFKCLLKHRLIFRGVENSNLLKIFFFFLLLLYGMNKCKRSGAVFWTSEHVAWRVSSIQLKSLFLQASVSSATGRVPGPFWPMNLLGGIWDSG